MSAEDDKELSEKLAEVGEPAPKRPRPVPAWNVGEAAPTTANRAEDKRAGDFVQWGVHGGGTYTPASKTRRDLPPGLYDICMSQAIGVYFKRVKTKAEGLIRFPHTNCDKVLSEIMTFWDRWQRFVDFGLPHKRGIMLWGPPGSGKSCTISLVMKDVIERGGVAIRFVSAALFLVGYRALREVQPDTPVVVLMEDIDSIIRENSESEVLNILDGVESVDRTVFLASTNYPELLGARIMNRPSRFDRRFKVGYPTPESRRMYFEHLLKGHEELVSPDDLSYWVEQSEGMSLAHLKELFVAVVILGNDADEALRSLKSMKENITSADDSRNKAGFGASSVLSFVTELGR